MNERHITDRQQVLADLARRGQDNRKEIAQAVRTAAPGAAQAVKIIGHLAYNLYTVDPVTLGAPGTTPTQRAEPAEAFNLAEPFLEEGALASGTYVLMFRVGTKNAFYAKP